jgi:hypothetical protein
MPRLLFYLPIAAGTFLIMEGSGFSNMVSIGTTLLVTAFAGLVEDSY